MGSRCAITGALLLWWCWQREKAGQLRKSTQPPYHNHRSKGNICPQHYKATFDWCKTTEIHQKNCPHRNRAYFHLSMTLRTYCFSWRLHDAPPPLIRHRWHFRRISPLPHTNYFKCHCEETDSNWQVRSWSHHIRTVLGLTPISYLPPNRLG